ncbi:uncharacterized protein [Dermacentor albipictus]|uniref:uncharacterized protein n=1 Tax=Dermacentor albipictus TaxID=60249 RepID=UPI0038FD3954
MEEASAIPKNIASLSDDAWLYQWNTQQRPITDGTYNVDGVTDNGSTSYLHLGSSNSFDHAWPSTSRTGLEQASTIVEGGDSDQIEYARLLAPLELPDFSFLFKKGCFSPDCSDPSHFPCCPKKNVAYCSRHLMAQPFQLTSVCVRVLSHF